MKTYVRWGELTTHPKYGNPVLQMISVELDENHREVVNSKVIGYMMPFRSYHFQLCGTYDGECSLGEWSYDGEAIFKEFNIEKYSRRELRIVYHAALNSTILKFLSNEYGKDFHPSYKLLAYYDKENKVEEFIEKTIDYLAVRK